MDQQRRLSRTGARTLASSFLVTMVLAALAAEPARATTIDPLRWDQLVLGADLVAVVECTTAGGIVARYKVVESFKGPPAGSEVAIEITVNCWEPQFPIVLIGQRLFVTAFRRPPSTMMSTSSGGPVPLWWRKIPSDYRTPLFQGLHVMPTDNDDSAFRFEDKSWKNVGDFRAELKRLMNLSPEEQELALVRAYLLKHLLGRHRDEAAEAKAEKTLAPVKTLGDALNYLLELVEREKDSTYNRGVSLLQEAGGIHMLDRLNTLPADRWPLSKHELEEVKKQIRRRLQVSAATRPATAPADEEEGGAQPKDTPSAETLKQLRTVLADQKSDRWGQAFTLLTRHDPSPVADYLAKWKNTGTDWSSADRGYGVGSFFAHFCGKDRAIQMRTLLRAEDPFVRVAGAVYLCFEDEKTGMAELEKTKSLPGDPGAWAALNLARRGEKQAVERMLGVFNEPGESNMAGVPHRNLQKRVMVLMSNSAKASGLPQPSPLRLQEDNDEARSTKAIGAYYLKWFQDNRQNLVLHDPWLAELSRQKMD
ncbi:MAG: hypothetical protein BWX88_01854 [Planctomycetes bacterium ADurb.Bin126]|nr:MAG: hypothetical protein BWX88_01854 [Planctomycetes bacterium ADurb.Bin126]HOD81664.1 hypothetical protein [Phycisphaerae bacterium]HQL74796.1 hypothetical protein [Phycisphaerae bacterium]